MLHLHYYPGNASLTPHMLLEELGVPFELTWSCYQDEVRACGQCSSCRLRRKGFAAAGVTDPIPYQP